MAEMDNKERREEIFSKAIRAGKRTYFFDVKATRQNEYYLTITESKRRFNNEQGKFFYEKHKLFLYKEDFDKFFDGLNQVVEFIRTGQAPEVSYDDQEKNEVDELETGNGFDEGIDELTEKHTDIDFEDLQSEDEAEKN